MAKLSLLEKAKTISRGKRKIDVSSEEIELIFAWLEDEISLTQAARAMGIPASGGFSARAVVIVREAYRAGLLTAKKGKN